MIGKREISIVFASLILIVTAGNTGVIAGVMWEGETWNPYSGSTLNVNGSNEFEVTPGNSADYGAGHINTDAAFRSLSTPAVSADLYRDHRRRHPPSDLD